jgi:hypothetical protein
LEWSKEDGESYAELDELYGALTGQFREIYGHVTKMLGIYDSPKTYDMTGNQFVVVPKVFKRCRCIPEHTIVYYSNLLNQDVLSKLTPIMVLRLSKGCRMRLTSLLAGDRMVRLLETSIASKDNYSVDELMTDLKSFF